MDVERSRRDQARRGRGEGVRICERARGVVEPKQQAFLAARLEHKPDSGQPWENSLGMKFVPVGAVRFCVWEVRVKDYDAFCAATGRRRDKPDFEQGPEHPVVNVNWN